ncbi:hypothetical protein [Anaeromyxobacter sp. Fw109-5]|uniref:hypothetical protein n=1 Tax=Anaeromyxobacter sp. (strain Fw109-5) TaxID=404589 RepID=UPI000158A877|nr:hypothetical protein [Anaeromyxobacter sp. Fw109-5]ABS28538.1 conserved hypothetical protein [Anaeromyxobacter sp. Fw109-5]
MITPHRPARLGALTASLAAAALACSTDAPAPIACDSSASCPPASRCLQRACTADAPPLATIAALGTVEANAIAVLDGSRSTDPDAPGDAVVSYEWSARSVDAPCDPPAIAGTTATTQVRFACPGRYEVTLVVVDELSVRSEPVTQLVEVAPRAGPPLVTAGADVGVNHRCAGDPLLCRAVTALGDAIALSGVSAVEGCAFRWTVHPPEGRPLDAARRVTFDPGPDVAAPVVRIETDGTAISGDWVFRVEARDGVGVVGAAEMRVSVANSAPVVTERMPAFHHSLSQSSSRFLVDDAITVAVSDPDGDPIEARSVTGHHVGDGGATFDVEDFGDRVAVRVELPYSQPSDALYLIGGEGLERAVRFAVRDVNGAETSETWPVHVGNRPPELVGEWTSTSVHHTYSAGAYRAAAALSTWVDPDGDPLVQAEPTSDAACATFTLDATGRVRLECSLSSPLAAAAQNFVGPHDVHQRVRDPWVEGGASVSRVEILNRPPVLSLSTIILAADCVETAECCDAECISGKLDVSAVSGEVTSFVTDPDGDPVQLTVYPGSTTVCLPSSCRIPVSFSADLTCAPSKNRTYSVSVTDGVGVATGAVTARRLCG